MTTELLPLNEIIVTDRVRKPDSPETLEHIEQLRYSLRRFGGHPKGLLQPILVDEHNVLQAGWCRYSAVRLEEWPTVPIYRRANLSKEEYEEVELEENFRRLGFTWREEVIQVCKIHRNRVKKALVAREPAWTQQMTGDLLGGYSDSYVSNCLRVLPKLDLPLYSNCDSLTDAVRIWYREKEDLGVAELARRTTLNRSTMPKLATTDKPCVACEGTGKNSKGNPCSPCNGTGFLLKLAETSMPQVSTTTLLDSLVPEAEVKEEVVDLSSTLFFGDSVRDLLPQWPPSCVDHIISDPPYGIDTANMDQSSTSLMDTLRVDSTHDVTENQILFQYMFPVFYRVLKDGGFCILWCDATQWTTLCSLARDAGFGVQNWPLFWLKTSPCKNQMAHVNFTKDYEIAIVCRKGNARLPRPVQTSVVQCPNDAEKASNPFAKPHNAWKFLVESVSIPGQTILEPFAGEGSGVVAGLRLNRRVLACEKDEQHYNYLVKNVKDYWQGVFRKVRFV
jgi:site-specific DNA-methyltransferase (adenine-specific)